MISVVSNYKCQLNGNCFANYKINIHYSTVVLNITFFWTVIQKNCRKLIFFQLQFGTAVCLYNKVLQEELRSFLNTTFLWTRVHDF